MSNLTPHNFSIAKKDRNKLNKHRSFLIWFTGLSGSGKSTIANALEKELHSQSIRTYVLDGDNVRKGINKNLSFSPEDRAENIRRIAEISNLFIEAGLVILAAFVSPYKKDRQDIKNIVGEENFIEVFINTPLEVCEKRDVKGLYKKARKGEISNFTGISSPYEIPETPDICINTDIYTIDEAVALLKKHISNFL